MMDSYSSTGTSFEERHFTIPELAEMWQFSREFVRQIVKDEPGVTEWVRQQPGRRRYRVVRVPQWSRSGCIDGPRRGRWKSRRLVGCTPSARPTARRAPGLIRHAAVSFNDDAISRQRGF